MTDQPQAPAGWYPIPDGRQRYWDGAQWTHNVVAAGPATPDQDEHPGASMPTFLSARSYGHGDLGKTLAQSYLGLVAVLLVGAAVEAALPGPPDGGFFFGFAMLATMPLSVGVMWAYTEMATAQGIPMSDQYGAWWVIPAFALCALINASLIWVIFRGRRIRPLVEAPPAPPWA